MKPLLACSMIFLSLQSYLLGQETVGLLFTVTQEESPFKPIQAKIEIRGPLARSGEFADDIGKLSIYNYQYETAECLITMDGYKSKHLTVSITRSEFIKGEKEILVKLEKAEINSFFVNGFVKGCNGMPVKGISVQVICGYDSLKIKQTDEWGWYQIEINLGKVGSATAEFSLIANFGDCLAEEIEKNVRRPGHTFRMDITKNCGCQGKGNGLIRDIKRGKPIPGATIEFVQNQEFPSSKVEVNKDGTFKLQNLSVGKNIAFKFTHSKYLPLISKSPEISQRESDNYFILNARKKSSYYFSGHHWTYTTGAIGLVFLIGGGCAYIKADNIHQAYTKNLNDQNFIAEYPQFNNREEGYAKVEKLRKTSAWMIPTGVGLLVGHFVVHCLENASYTKKVDKEWQSRSNSLSIYGSISGIHLVYSFN